MLTIFTLPKPFTDPHIRTIQRNAIQSWKKLGPEVEVILMGKDSGIAETAKEFGVRYVADVAVNEFGTPLLDSAFDIAQKIARHGRLMYVNADVIFIADLIAALDKLPKESMLTVVRRIDLDVKEWMDFNDQSWARKISDEARNHGSLHSWAGIDYFIFNKGRFISLPPFAVGRVGWDNWVVHESRHRLRYTIDATACITAIHQNHGYSGNNAGTQRKTNPEAQKNSSFTKKPAQSYTIEDANWKLGPSGLKRNYLYSLPHLKRSLKLIWKR